MAIYGVRQTATGRFVGTRDGRDFGPRGLTESAGTAEEVRAALKTFLYSPDDVLLEDIQIPSEDEKRWAAAMRAAEAQRRSARAGAECARAAARQAAQATAAKLDPTIRIMELTGATLRTSIDPESGSLICSRVFTAQRPGHATHRVSVEIGEDCYAEGKTCDCTGYKMHGDCQHITAVCAFMDAHDNEED